MVPTITGLRGDRETGCHRVWVVEIVGPAGAGKTTLYQALAKFDPAIQTNDLPPVWKIQYIPFFVKQILLLVPTLLRIRRKGDRSLTRRELAWMAMLLGWPTILKNKAEGDHKVILLDQGPIFLMAILSEFGPESLLTSDVESYWKKVNEQWAHTLDMVVWLDAPDEILMNRIRTRSDDHMVKDKTDQEIKDFLSKYRRAYERYISAITMSNPEFRVLKMDTGKNSRNELVRCVLQSLPNGMIHP